MTWRRIGVPCALAGVVAALAAAATATGAAAPDAACGKVLPPAQGVYFGVMPGWDLASGTFDDVVDAATLPLFERLTGRRAVFVPWSLSWHSWGLRFPTKAVELLWREGVVPQIRLFSYPTMDYAPGPLPEPPGPIPASDIAAGRHDAELRRFADAARATDVPIELDFDPEMTAAHPWGGRFDGGGTTTGYGDPAWPDGPEHFRDAYRRIVEIFRQEGATNVTFVFQVNAVSGYVAGSYWEPWERYRWYYPGDDYIDWIGLSVYAEPKFNTGPNESFEDKLAFGDTPGYEGPYAEITALGSKPLSINELGLYRMPSEEAKASWVEDASAVLQSGRYPRIKAIVWWADNKGGDYNGYPDTSQTFLDGFKTAFDQPFFDAKAEFGGDCRPLAPAHVTLKDGTLSWRPVPNASGYQVWRGSKVLSRTADSVVSVGRSAGPAYRVRAVNIVGFGPFVTAP